MLIVKERKKTNMNQASIDFKKIACYAKLENTRMLYDFMQALSDRIPKSRENDYKWKYTGYNGAGGLPNRESLYTALGKALHNEEKDGLLDNCFIEESGNIKYLKQNPLSTYLKFYNEFLGENNNFSQITYCLQYFNTLRYLADDNYPIPSRNKNDLPYLYEDLCLSIREMTECYAAYILYVKEGETAQLISGSGYVVYEKEDDTEPPHFTHELWNKLISEIGNAKENGNLNKKEIIIDGVYKLRQHKENRVNDYLAIVLPLNDNDNNSGNIYIVLDYLQIQAETGEDENTFEVTQCDENAIYNILFMRNRLLSCLKRDYAVLLNFRYDCSYIKSTTENANSLKILHISDLHLNELNQEILMDGIDLPDFSRNNNQIDLLAITGDIVNASSNASEAQEKYRLATKFVRKLAKCLWGLKNKKTGIVILPHDWKRRILIVPGNHDYTTMSDVVVETESRKIKAAFPANESAGTMSKLTYYIEFLADCLDVPIVEFVKNDMNEVRDYKNLKVTVGLFNTVAQSNSLQNNKVGFTQEERLGDLLNKKGWWKSADKEDYTRVALSHHSPLYEINYFDDKYKCWSFNEYKIKPSVNEFILETLLKDIWKKVSDELAKQNISTENFYKIFRDLSIDDIKLEDVVYYLANELPNSISDKQNDKFFKSDLRRDLEKLYKILQKGKKSEPFSEFDLAFIAQWWSLAKMQTDDQTAFKNVWHKLGKVDDKSLLCFAGHEHKYHKEKGIYVEDQMYNGDNGEYNWSILQISKRGMLESKYTMNTSKIYRRIHD